MRALLRGPCLLLLATSCLVAADASAAVPPRFLRTCVVSAPDPVPLWSRPGAAGAAGNLSEKDDDTGDDAAADEDDSEDDDDGDDDAPRGFVSPGSDTCVAVSGTVSFGLQSDWFRANALTKSLGLAPPDATSFPLTASFRIESGRLLGDGSYLATAFEVSIDGSTGSETTLAEASVTLGPWSFGLASSRYDFWTGEDFVLTGRIPDRTVGLIAFERALTKTLKVSFSAEDTQVDSRALPEQGGRRVPDGVARLVSEGDALTLHAAMAVRELPPVAGIAGRRVGYAWLLGATWEDELLGRTTTLSGQIARAVDAATYLGSKLDRLAVRSLLTGDDTTQGWSGVVSLGRQWSEHWSTNVYASRYQLTLPRLGVSPGKIVVDRMAANLVWTPLKGFKAGVEASAARQSIDLVGRSTAAALAGRQMSVQLFVERSF
jgi:hypothetical protein